MNKTIAKHIIFILTIGCFAIPMVKWYASGGSQFSIFSTTWLFIIYGILFYVFGQATIKTLYDE